MIGFDSLIDLADKLGVIQAVKGKLLSQPDPAADKLITVLDEISKIYLSLDSEIVAYLSLALDPADLAQDRAVLLTLEGGQLKARMGIARGHCHKIANIHANYLSPWFNKILSPAEATLLKELFDSLTIFDNNMLDAIDALADWLSEEALATLNFVDAGEFGKANQRIQDARKIVYPHRRAVGKAMRDLLNLQSEFIGISGAI